jgi:ferritin-like metal-binding protein YciE
MPPEEIKNMTVRNLEYLFHEILKDLYYLSNRLLSTLSKMADGTNSIELAAIFESRAGQTKKHVSRLEKVFAILGKPPEGRTWPIIDGMIDEGPDFVEHYRSSPALDAGLLASAQAVTQYEITRYMTLKRWAAMLGMQEAVRLLDEALLESIQSNRDMNALADRMANAGAPATILAFEAAPRGALLSEVA